MDQFRFSINLYECDELGLISSNDNNNYGWKGGGGDDGLSLYQSANELNFFFSLSP